MSCCNAGKWAVAEETGAQVGHVFNVPFFREFRL